MAAGLSPANQTLAAQIAAVPLAIRGYGHVKLANLALARGREAELLHRFAPERYPRPVARGQGGADPRHRGGGPVSAFMACALCERDEPGHFLAGDTRPAN